ncbi:MAG: hypothetical protein H0V80_10170 [Acidobacteria bacterium]|nr:hypothetical protein [Acidobacteriota bacterium]
MNADVRQQGPMVVVIPDHGDSLAIAPTVRGWKVFHIRGLHGDQIGPLHPSLAAAKAYAESTFGILGAWRRTSPTSCTATVRERHS